jgi:hypothetical protein
MQVGGCVIAASVVVAFVSVVVLLFVLRKI